MKKIILICVISLFHITNTMETEPDDGDTAALIYKQFTSAIISGNKEKVEQCLKSPIIKPDEYLTHEGKERLSLTLAMATKNTAIAQLLARKFSEQYSTLKGVLKDPFHYFAQNNNAEGIDALMQLDIPPQLKDEGCELAATIALLHLPKSRPVVEKLFNSYGKHIKHPCWNYSFQQAAINSYEKHKEIIHTILKHPKAAKDLEEMITSDNLWYPDKEGQYRNLLQIAKLFQALGTDTKKSILNQRSKL